MCIRTFVIALLVLSAASPCYAGGPAFIAGAGYSPGVEGQPLIWLNGSVQYFTDQGDLSPILPAAQADAFVAAAFSTWTTLPSVALTATQGGHLAEDVNGSNIQVASNGIITAPADITPSATSTPVGIVYDYDGTVTDALLGQGAGDLSECFSNAVFGGADNFSNSGNIVHAVVIINGVCAAQTSQLTDVQYRLVRVLAHIMGLGWSQADLNVQTNNPPPGPADYAGFPVMHFMDSIACVPITVCYPNPTTPAVDDIDSLTRLYPNSAYSQPTGRIHGSVYFTNAAGAAVQPMQGVNVVARLINSGQPSRQYVATSVSGFAFSGNAGNIVLGYLDPNGLPYDRWGSNDPSLEGFFDLGQLPIPVGQTVAEYQLSVEALDPNWSLGVGPYGPTQVTPSGSFATVTVTVASGTNEERDILMSQDEIASIGPGANSNYQSPVALPTGGQWGSWVSGYGSTDFFQFTAQANRTASVSVTALDESGRPTETKLQPIIGVWEASDNSGNPAPASTTFAFNSTTFGMSRLDAQFNSTESYKIGIVDDRGDGRPDYFYQGSLLYADSVNPARISLAGGVTELTGVGFTPNLQVTAANSTAPTLSQSATQMQVDMPAAQLDGIATIQVTNPVTGAFSQMIGALTYGAAATDLLLGLQLSEPSTPVNSRAANPIRVRAVASDGVTPVNGATIAWSANNGLQFSVCGGASSCSVLSDAAGESSSWVTPTFIGASTITIALAPESYSPPQTQQATVVGTSSALALAALFQTRWIAQGATLTVPLTVEALDLGVPQGNVTVNYNVIKGTASLSATNATTNPSGFAMVNVQLANMSSEVDVTACAAPNNAPCLTFTLFSVPASSWKLETVSGGLQAVPVGQSFQPLVMRVTDGSKTDNPVMGATVVFNTTLARAGANGLPVLLGTSQSQQVSDQNGLASIVPSVGSVGQCQVFITVSAGSASVELQMQSVPANASSGPGNFRWRGDPVKHVPWMNPSISFVPTQDMNSSEVLEDKRSCRVLQAEKGWLP